jgi:hypothetical protein
LFIEGVQFAMNYSFWLLSRALIFHIHAEHQLHRRKGLQIDPVTDILIVTFDGDSKPLSR